MHDAFLEVKPSSGRTFSYPLEQQNTRIGRDSSVDLVIAEKKEIPLKDGDDITLGLTALKFHIGEADEKAPPTRRLMRTTQEYFSINDLLGRVGTADIPEPMLKLLVRLAEEVLPESEPVRIYQAALRIAIDLMHAEKAAVLTHPRDGELVISARHPAGTEFEVPEHFYAAVVERRGVVLIRDDK
jgi:hypothetical protein